MKIEKRTIYICEFCGREFLDEKSCKSHEKDGCTHKCSQCIHSYYVYGSEQNCTLKKCKFKSLDDKDNK